MDPNRPAFSPSAEDPFIKIWTPGSLWGSSGTCTLLDLVARKEHLGPRPTRGEVFIRQTEDGARYICVAVRVLHPDRTVEFQWGTQSQSLIIRRLEQVFRDAGLDMDERLIYRMDCMEAEDEDYGSCLAGVWSAATAHPVRQRGNQGSADAPPEEEPTVPAGSHG